MVGSLGSSRARSVSGAESPAYHSLLKKGNNRKEGNPASVAILGPKLLGNNWIGIPKQSSSVAGPFYRGESRG